MSPENVCGWDIVQKWIFGQEPKLLKGEIWKLKEYLSTVDIVSRHTSKPEGVLFKAITFPLIFVSRVESKFCWLFCTSRSSIWDQLFYVTTKQVRFFFQGNMETTAKRFLKDFLNFCSREKVKMQIKMAKKVYPDGAGSIVYGRETSCLNNMWMCASKTLTLWPDASFSSLFPRGRNTCRAIWLANFRPLSFSCTKWSIFFPSKTQRATKY